MKENVLKALWWVFCVAGILNICRFLRPVGEFPAWELILVYGFFVYGTLFHVLLYRFYFKRTWLSAFGLGSWVTYGVSCLVGYPICLFVQGYYTNLLATMGSLYVSVLISCWLQYTASQLWRNKKSVLSTSVF